MKYSPLTRRFAKWLFPLIDPYDWGHDTKAGPRPTSTNARLNVYYSGHTWAPKRLTRTALESHLSRTDKLYYTSRRGSGFALVCIDVDAHRGETDAFETACFIRDRYFPGSYLEPSKRGYHLYLVIRIGFNKRETVNEALQQLQNDLSVVVDEFGFKSKVEVLGRFTLLVDKQIETRAKMTPLPLLLNQSNMSQLEAMPVFYTRILDTVSDEAETIRETRNQFHDTHTNSVYIEPIAVPKGQARRDSVDAWERMQWACWDYTVIYRALPSVDELLSYYGEIYQSGPITKDRQQRAERAIKYRAKTFSEALAEERGYEPQRDCLLQAVKDHCNDRQSKYTAQITDEDLAIALYTIQRNSFRVYPDKRQQWSTPNKLFGAMFDALRKAKLTTRGCANRNKAIALKTILERAKLIECVDRQYVHGEHWGVGKKYTIGPSHWRYQQFLRWSQPIQLILVRDLSAAELPAEMRYDPTTARQEIECLLTS